MRGTLATYCGSRLITIRVRVLGYSGKIETLALILVATFVRTRQRGMALYGVVKQPCPNLFHG